MTCSRTDLLHRGRLYWGWFLGVATAALMLPGLAVAQDLPPAQDDAAQSDLPSDGGETSESLSSLQEIESPETGSGETESGETVTDEQAAPPEPDRSKPPQSVEVDALGAMRIGGLGLIPADEGGLPASLWSGSSADGATMRLLALPEQAPSRVLQELERRLLLTTVPSPEMPNTQADLDFMSARLDRLAATGDLAGVVAFLDRIGHDYRHDNLTRLAIDVNFLTNRSQDACAVAAASHPEDVGPNWLRITAFCRALGGDVDGASLALDMLAEQKATAPAYDQLISAFIKQVASGNEATAKTAPKLKSLRGATPLVLALVRETRADLPADAMTGATAMVRASFADNSDLPLLQRIRAAETVAARGGLGLEKLAALYAALPVKAADLENPLARVAAEPAKSVYANALLYQAAARAENAESRLAILLAGYARARAEGTRMLYANVMRPFVEQIPPAAENLALAGDVLRMLLLAGRIETAEDWYGTLRRQAALGSPEAEAQAAALWPLMMVWAPRPQDMDAQGGVAVASYSPAFLNDWITSRANLAPEARARQIALVGLLLSRAGFDVPADLVPQTGDAKGDTGFDLVIVGREGRLGETILEAMKLTGRGLSKLDADAVVTLGDVFRSQGLDREARRIVTEAMVIQGF